MKKCLLLLAFVPCFVFAQKKYSTKTAKVKFYSHTAAEDIQATNSQGDSKLNSNGTVNFSLLIKGFVFENALMQQHFNEKEYMNSAAFPKTSFAGKINNIASVNFTKNGTYKVTVSGNLVVKGKTKAVTATGTIVVNGAAITATSVFKIRPKDFGIAASDIAEHVEIAVTANYK